MNSKVKWDPIAIKLADYKLKEDMYSKPDDVVSSPEIRWADAVQKRRSKEDFEKYLHELFDVAGPEMKYQNPDSWNVYPNEEKKVKSK